MRFRVNALALLCVASLVGCGDDGPVTAPVQGKITLDGEPYPNAILNFSPVGGGPAGIGKSDASGTYEIYTAGKRGAVHGTHKVSIVTEVVADPNAKSSSDIRSDDPEYAKLMAAGAKSPRSLTPPKEPLPGKYNVKTELTAEVKSGKNAIDWPLKK